MSCHAHRLCAHCVIAMHCSLNCSTPPLPQEPPRFITALVALRQRQRKSVVATNYLRVVSASPTLDIYQPLYISSICCLREPGPKVSCPGIFLAVGTVPEQRQLDSGDEHTVQHRQPEATESRSEPRDARTRPADRDGSSGAGAAWSGKQGRTYQTGEVWAFWRIAFTFRDAFFLGKPGTRLRT